MREIADSHLVEVVGYAGQYTSRSFLVLCPEYSISTGMLASNLAIILAGLNTEYVWLYRRMLQLLVPRVWVGLDVG